jgi:bifunctional oligoribonuclease and PAP phosphatase NrnA
MIDEQIRDLINSANTIGIVSHVRPDGDAIGSVLGLGLALKNAGKQVHMVLKDGVVRTFRHLPGTNLVEHAFEEPCDLYIAVDSSDLKRTGGVLGLIQPDINIDHHITNDSYGKVNLIDEKAVATCEVLAQHIPSWGLEITLDVAANLLSGIVSDSIGFRTTNTRPQSLRIAADLMEKGVNISELYYKALISRSFEAATYWGFALGRMERLNRLVWTALTLEDRKNSKYPGNDDADLTNVLSSIEDIDIAVLFVEQSADKTKVSWRSRPGVDVSVIASELGGGGHPAAAGADLDGTFEAIKERVLSRTIEFLEQQGNSKSESLGAKKE